MTNANSAKNEETPLPVNKFYLSLRYYFPVKNQFTWDRQTMKKKRARKRERMKRKQQRIHHSKTQNSRNKNVWNLFSSKKD